MHGKLKTSRENKLAAKIRNAIGATENEEVEFITPQFTREPGRPGPGSPPDDWESLGDMNAQALREIGLRPWDEPKPGDDKILWLFPGEWYPFIPKGMKIIDLWLNEETFVPGVTDDDIRFGCLSYGIMGPKLAARPTDGGTK